jgi:hypothetical protein
MLYTDVIIVVMLPFSLPLVSSHSEQKTSISSLFVYFHHEVVQAAVGTLKH